MVRRGTSCTTKARTVTGSASRRFDNSSWGAPAKPTEEGPSAQGPKAAAGVADKQKAGARAKPITATNDSTTAKARTMSAIRRSRRAKERATSPRAKRESPRKRSLKEKVSPPVKCSPRARSPISAKGEYRQISEFCIKSSLLILMS
jgi:hypothetical protein